MTRPTLKVVEKAQETPAAPRSRYAAVSGATRMDFDELQARVGRVGTWLAGSFSSEAKREAVLRDLDEIEVLARNIRTGVQP